MIHVTDHAVESYAARVKPGMDPAAAKAELLALVRLAGDPVPELDWKHTGKLGGSYLEISDGIALILQGNRAVTVVVRGSHGEFYRQRKTERKKRRREERKKRNHYSQRHQRNTRRSETSGVTWPE